MYALMIARHKLYPQVSMLMLMLMLMLIWFTQHKKYGMRAIKGQLIMYTSQHVSSTKHHQSVTIVNLQHILCHHDHDYYDDFNLQHHYSIKGGASAIGLGTDNCVQVMCDEK